MKDTVRSFVAIELPPEIVAELLAAGELIRASAPDWSHEKWVAEANLHITLKFLGNLSGAQLEELSVLLGDAIPRISAFELALDGVRAVPSARRSSMLWATFRDASGASAALFESVDAIAAEIGVEQDSRAFKPHVTLVRSRRPRHLSPEALTSANTLLKGTTLSMSVPSVTLFASTLTPSGPVYERVASWALRTAM